MNVTRSGRSFTVVDDPATATWDFWQGHYATNRWEPYTLTALDDLLTPDSTYLDIGAWVGPTVMWAAPLCRHVVAVEPDPVACAVLRENVAQNHTNVTVIEKALAAKPGTAALTTRGTWGDSCSTLLEARGDSVLVETTTIDDLLAGLDDVALVKIDIEGGEAEAFPAAAETLHALGCPILLSLHLDWIPEVGPLTAAVATFDSTVIDSTNAAFPTLLLR